MWHNNEVATVIWVNLVCIRVIRDDAKIILIDLAVLLWKYTRWLMVGFYNTHLRIGLVNNLLSVLEFSI